MARLLALEERLEAAERVIEAFLFGEEIGAAALGEESAASRMEMFIDQDLLDVDPQDERRLRVLHRARALISEIRPRPETLRGLRPDDLDDDA